MEWTQGHCFDLSTLTWSANVHCGQKKSYQNLNNNSKKLLNDFPIPKSEAAPEDPKVLSIVEAKKSFLSALSQNFLPLGGRDTACSYRDDLIKVEGCPTKPRDPNYLGLVDRQWATFISLFDHETQIIHIFTLKTLQVWSNFDLRLIWEPSQRQGWIRFQANIFPKARKSHRQLVPGGSHGFHGFHVPRGVPELTDDHRVSDNHPFHLSHLRGRDLASIRWTVHKLVFTKVSNKSLF